VSQQAVGLNHVSVVAHDLAESVRFYREVFGMEELPTPDFGFPVQWLRLGDLQLHLFERPDGPPVYAHFAIEVDDVVALVAEAQRREILDHTTFGYAMAELPGGEAQVYLRDPAGNLVEVDAPDGAAAREQIPGMILFTERRPQPDGPVPRLFLGRGR
jgi:catechol 2,3-dioxygenase-like lactoylglutathione lyase family enzyme